MTRPGIRTVCKQEPLCVSDGNGVWTRPRDRYCERHQKRAFIDLLRVALADLDGAGTLEFAWRNSGDARSDCLGGTVAEFAMALEVKRGVLTALGPEVTNAVEERVGRPVLVVPNPGIPASCRCPVTFLSGETGLAGSHQHPAKDIQRAETALL